MKIFFSLLICAITAIGSSSLQAETYQVSAKPYTMTWPNGKWDGKFSKSIFCLNFPNAENAKELTQAMFNNNSLYVIRVPYEENIVVGLAITTRPPSQSADEDIELFLKKYRSNAQRASEFSQVYEVSELATDFGKVIGLRFNNIVSDTPGTGPFPVGRGLMQRSDDKIISMSVHRFFERGPDRFELGVLKIAQEPLLLSDENQMKAELTHIADQALLSLQQCSASLPLRTLK